MLQLFQVQEVTLTDQKIAATLSLQEADTFGCLRLVAFDFQLKFKLKYTNVVLKENQFFLIIYTVQAF